MHIDLETTKLVPEETQEFNVVIRKYKEEVLVQEETHEHHTHTIESEIAQGKLWCITHNL